MEISRLDYIASRYVLCILWGVSRGTAATFCAFAKYKYPEVKLISPLSSVESYPENVPTVCITSKKDNEVPCENTRRIAERLSDKGKNDVYLLELEESSHPSYMFDNSNDRDKYECFIHAIYEKYHLPFDFKLAEQGRKYLDACMILPTKSLVSDLI